MSAPDLGPQFEYHAKPGEIVVSLQHVGFAGIDMGPAYFIDNSYKKPLSKAGIKPENRQAEVKKVEDAITRVEGALKRMQERADKVGIEIRDVYENLLDTELLMFNDLARKIKKAGNTSILESGINAERCIADFFKSRKTDREAKERARESQGNKIDRKNPLYQKAINYENFFEAALINAVRGQDLQTLDRIRGDLPPHEAPVPISNNFQVGHLAFLRNESGHGTKVHSLLRTEGTPGDHTEVIAKGLRIAIATITPDDMSRIKDSGKPIIVDGIKGVVIVNPDEKTLDEYEDKMLHEGKRNRTFAGVSQKIKWPRTNGGHGDEIRISGNIAFADEMYAIRANNAAAVGLYRTEVAIKARADLDGDDTSLEKFVEIYGEVAKNSVDPNGKVKSVTFRTPDFEADKDIEGMTDEKRQEYIENSVRGLMRAKKDHSHFSFHIMFPMIQTAQQFSEMRSIVHDIAAEEGVENPKCGAMIETPGAISDMQFMDADFYSVGTNDLIPLLLNYNRYKDSESYDPTDPKVIKALHQIVQNAQKQDKADKLSMCGDLASDPHYLAMLIGLGYKHLSAGPGEVPFHKAFIPRINKESATRLVFDLSQEEDPAERKKILDDYNEENLGLYPNGAFEEHWEPQREITDKPDWEEPD